MSAFMHMHALHVLLVPSEVRRGHQAPCNWSYEVVSLRVVPGTEPFSLEEWQVGYTTDPSI